MTCHTVRVLSPLESRLVSKVGLFLALILLLFVTGCTPTDLDRGGVTHLTLWQGINPPPNRDIFQKLVDKFNRQHPNIQVESLYVGQADQQLPKILTATIGDAAPDLLWFGPMLTGQLVDLDAIVPLDKFWQQSAIRQEIDPALRESMEYEQHLWSVPFGTNNVGIFYRPSLFKEAKIEHLPTNWAELKSTAKQLSRDSNGDGKIDRHGILLPNTIFSEPPCNSPPPPHINGSQVNTVHSPLPKGNNIPCRSILPSPLLSRLSCFAVDRNSAQLVGKRSIPASLNKLGR